MVMMKCFLSIVGAVHSATFDVTESNALLQASKLVVPPGGGPVAESDSDEADYDGFDDSMDDDAANSVESALFDDDNGSESDDVPEALVTELAYLSGGIGQHTVKLLDTLGWVAGPSVVDDSSGQFDTMQVYTKNGKCAVVFSATDDVVDDNQQMMGSVQPTPICGVDDVNGGYAQEMSQYIQTPSWHDALQLLGGGNCQEGIYATGHSMGGAMASLFAFCVNSKDHPHASAFGGGLLPEVNLVTFGASAPSKTPLYNGEPGKCFKGTRRFVYVEPNPTSKQFSVTNLKIFAELADLAGGSGSGATLLHAASLLESDGDYPSVASKHILEAAHTGIGPLWLVAFAIMQNRILPGKEGLKAAYPLFQQKWGRLMQSSIHDLFYNYDPVPVLFTATMGYRHPLVEAKTAQGSRGCAEAESFPNHDAAQMMFGIMAHNAGNNFVAFPNHNMCCIIDDADCASKFTGTGYGVICSPAFFR